MPCGECLDPGIRVSLVHALKIRWRDKLGGSYVKVTLVGLRVLVDVAEAPIDPLDYLEVPSPELLLCEKALRHHQMGTTTSIPSFYF
jgi:hypothetical protein